MFALSLLMLRVAFGATASDGAVCNSMDAVEAYESRRLELQYTDLGTVTAAGATSAWQAEGVPGVNSQSLSVSQEGMGSRQYRITTGYGRVVTDFNAGWAVDPHSFWTFVGREEVYLDSCEAPISEEAHRDALLFRRTRVSLVWGAAAASHVVGLIAWSQSAPDTTAQDNWTGPPRLAPEPVPKPGAKALAAVGTGAGVALGATGLIALAALTPPSPYDLTCDAWSLDELEEVRMKWNRDLRAGLDCR